jgi:hypothetical protein
VSVLPSPIPHPLDYCPWDLPGWVYEALDWVIGVEWPEGNERAVWDLADQWYGVAAALAGPHEDAVDAASEVRSGYGSVGSVAEAFDTAWRRVAEGDEAPLPVLLAVSGDLGRLVEECGCDIEGAKLEVWIELGILVVELLSLAVATVLTAGAASPAAGAAITATRLVIQQIFKRLMAQLARKSLKQGLKEAGERAAKEVAQRGVRGLARRAALGGLAEAGEEAGVSLATQAYQNSTGRRHGLDVADVGMSAVGGLAGGAVAPLAGLGRHATGRATRIGEHVGREMTGEMIAEGAAGLATGQGVSLEDIARAAASGASGSATGQTDHALQARLDGRLGALAGAPFTPMDLGSQPPPLVAGGDSAPHHPDLPPPSTGIGEVPSQRNAASVDVGPSMAPDADAVRDSLAATGALATPADRAVPAGAVHAEALTSPTLSSVAVESPPAPAFTAVGGGMGVPADALPTATDAGASRTSVTGPGVSSAQAAPGTTSLSALSPTYTSSAPAAGHLASHAGGGATVTGPDTTPPPTPPRFPLLEALDPGPAPSPVTDSPSPTPTDPAVPRPRTPEWYAARRAADREAFDRRRYRGYYEAQRAWYEDKRRRDEASRLRERSADQERRASEYAAYALRLHRGGQEYLAKGWRAAADDEMRGCFQSRDRAEAVLAGTAVPEYIEVNDRADFQRINDDVADLAPGAVETDDQSALTGDEGPPPVDRSRPYGRWGGLRTPLALHQTDLEREMPRDSDGRVVRTADPRQGRWFQLANDGGPAADPTRGINCLDCTLSLYETWVHGRPRVSAPRTFDAYAAGDIASPLWGEFGGPGRVEQVTGGTFQMLCAPVEGMRPAAQQHAVERGFGRLHDQLTAGGHGSYAFVITTWERGGSHAWVALNQNGRVLYLDPQRGEVSDSPLYTNHGVPEPGNVTAVDALLLGGDGQPMLLSDVERGQFSERPEPLDPPSLGDEQHDVPYIDRMHLLEGPAAVVAGMPHGDGAQVPWQPGSGTTPDAEALRQARVQAHADRVSGDASLGEILASSADLDGVFAAGVTPGEAAAELDPSTLRSLVPHLDESAAQDAARLLRDARVRQMLDEAWQNPPRGEPILAETLFKQLVQRPDLVRMILATPELANSLTARPMTLLHLATHQQAIDALGSVLNEIAERGPDVLAAEGIPSAQPTPLTGEQRQISASIVVSADVIAQPGFDHRRRADTSYCEAYLDELYASAAAAQVDLNKLATDLAQVDGKAVGTAEWRPDPKSRSRAQDKILKYRGDVSRLLDLAAAKVEFPCLEHLYGALARMRDHPTIHIVRFEDRFQVPQESGYRDVQLILRMSNGHLAEFRLHLASLDKVAFWEHALYEVRRDLDSLARRDARPLTAVERAISYSVLRRERQLFWDALLSTYKEGT